YKHCRPAVGSRALAECSSSRDLCSEVAAAPDTYTLSLHDALPISTTTSDSVSPAAASTRRMPRRAGRRPLTASGPCSTAPCHPRSEEHTSELQSRENLVCRLLLEKKKYLYVRLIVVRCV